MFVVFFLIVDLIKTIMSKICENLNATLHKRHISFRVTPDLKFSYYIDFVFFFLIV